MTDVDFPRIFEESPDVLLVLLPDKPRYTMVAATRARYRVTHTTPEQTIGRGLFDVFPDNPDDPSASGVSNLRASLDRVLATKAADTMAVQKYDIRGPDGAFEARHWSPVNIPVLSEGGDVRYILHRVEDVTGLVRANEVGDAANRELRAANEKLADADRAKTVFFANVSHELRTPLTLMVGPLEEVLAAGEATLPAALRANVMLAHANALRMTRLVNALLDFAALDADRLRASFAPVDAASATAEIAAMFDSAITKAGLRFVVDCRSSSDPVWVDRDLWEKIVSNLISNAFKFTLHGEIAVRVRDESGGVVLEVADTGVGIPPDGLTKIFERFHRIPGQEGRTHEGTGIGLSLVRELVELHGGEVTVASELGRGTTFTVRLKKGSAHLPPDAVAHVASRDGAGTDPTARRAPREPSLWPTATDSIAAAVQTETAISETPGQGHVLVVDDNPEVRRYIAALLSPVHEVSTAVDGVEALDSFQTRLPDIVVSDLMMPNLDGFGLLRAMRATPKTAVIPFIMLSARAGEEAAIDGLDAGADDYLVKPFSARELRARVRAHLQMARSRRAWSLELEAVNRELDAFSYSISHDLRAPIRAIDGFSRAIVEDFAEPLGANGRALLDRVRSNVQRMTMLIDDLLGLARIARLPLEVATVDLSAVASAIVADLRAKHPDRVVAFSCPASLLARGDSRLLRIVLTNLLGNAWKFTRPTADAHVELGRHPSPQPTFFVRDDGAGFDMSYAKRLFTPFQRMHSSREFEGTGIGLATACRVISRHGGRIWAEAAVGKGATFFFTLPGEAARAAAKVP